MILGRPYQLWLGLTSAITAFIAYVGVNVFQTDPEITLGIVAGINAILLALMVLVSGQPPVVNVGDKYVVQTPSGEENVTKVATTNVTPIPPNTGVTPTTNP